MLWFSFIVSEDAASFCCVSVCPLFNASFFHSCRANPVWLDPFCRNLELAVQADHEDDLPENLSEITDLWNSPARTHVISSPAFPHSAALHVTHRLY